MLILSNGKKDYYDGVVQTTGIDKTIVYNRHQNDIENSFKDYKNLPKDLIKLVEGITAFNIDLKKTTIEFQGIYVIAFCGKMHVLWHLLNKTSFNDVNPESIFTYNLNDVKGIVKTIAWHQQGDVTEAYKAITNYDPMSLHRLHNTPVFAINTSFGRYGGRDSNFIINPILKPYRFYKVFNSFAALQEIQMFISGVLGTNENSIIELSDQSKIAKHGFDKNSFRKEKRT